MPVRPTYSQVVKILIENGFCMVSQKGSHQKWRNYETGKITIVPCHGNKPIPIGTLNSIIRATGLSKELFGF